MGISYMRLRELLIERGVQRKALKPMAGLSNQVMSKINKDEHMSTDSLEKIARALGVEIGDIISLKP